MSEGFPNMGNEHELDRDNPEIKWGELPLNGGIENPTIWRGSISAKLDVLKERFGFTDNQDVIDLKNSLKSEIVKFYVRVREMAQVRCIDGRGEDENLRFEPALGPQVPGGTPVMALAWRIALGLTKDPTKVNQQTGTEDDEIDIAELNFDKDLVSFKDILKNKGLPFIPGAHEDEHNADDPENTGCGAIDKMLDILKIMGEFDEHENGRNYRVYDYTKAVALEYCGNDEVAFDSIFENIQVNLQAINGHHFNDRYFLRDEKTGRHHFRKRIVNRIKDVGYETGRKTVEKLRGKHNEIFLIINRVKNETLDRDGFAAVTGGQAQAFGYDVWHAVGRAEAIFPDDEEKQRTMIMTNVMYAVATAMELTDGSLEYGIRE